ncbi:MAG: hypothetical protein ABSC94_29700 [Polyangiaceae bacterium]|jgi:hypothetical protein
MPAVNPNEIRINLSTLVLLLAVVGGGAYAAGSALPAGAAPKTATGVAVEPPLREEGESEPEDLPPGHPPVDDTTPQQIGGMGVTSPEEETSLEWKAPVRWQLVPNTSTMRLATYRVPRAAGDIADAELSITRAGGSADANAERWIHQFDDAGQRTAKRTTRAVGLAEVAIVEVEGTYSGGMSKEGSSQRGWALLGAIVSTPGTPYFFKLTGPEKSVHAARKEFEALIDSLVQHRDRGT